MGPYQPIGVTTDQIVWYPSVTAAAFYDDNVFARHSNRQGDWAAVVRPEMAWRTNNWANMQLAGAYFVESRSYHRFDSEDQVNGGAVVGGTLRAGENTQVVTRLQYLHAHEDRGTSDFDQHIVPAAASIRSARGRRRDQSALRPVLDVIGRGRRLHPVRQRHARNGVQVSQDYRTGSISSMPIRVGYVVAPLTSLFVEVSPNQRDFDVNAFDSNGWRVVGGALFEPGPGSRIKGEIFGGYMSQNYSFGFHDISTFTYGSALRSC